MDATQTEAKAASRFSLAAALHMALTDSLNRTLTNAESPRPGAGRCEQLCEHSVNNFISFVLGILRY